MTHSSGPGRQALDAELEHHYGASPETARRGDAIEGQIVADTRRRLAARLATADGFDVTTWDGPAAASDDFLAGLRFAAELLGDLNGFGH